MNAASKSNLAISSFMPQNVLPLPANAPKTQQMLETSVSQTSQSRDPSLTSHKTATAGIPVGQAGAGRGGGGKHSVKKVTTASFLQSGKQNLVIKQAGTRVNNNGGIPR